MKIKDLLSIIIRKGGFITKREAPAYIGNIFYNCYKVLGNKEIILKDLKLREKDLEMKRELYQGQPHPSLASSLNNVGASHKALGDKENVLKGLKTTGGIIGNDKRAMSRPA